MKITIELNELSELKNLQKLVNALYPPNAPKSADMPDGISIDELDLSLRAYNGLKRAGIHTVNELVLMTPGELLKIDNFGVKSLNEVRDELNAKNLSLAGVSYA